MNSKQLKNNTHRILLVDDHEHSARIVARLLVRQGFATIVTSSGDEAMERLADERVDAVISDVHMPGMNGFELLQNIHVRHPQLPVILMTAFLEEGMRESALAWGAAALLQKPFTSAELTAALAVALEGTEAILASGQPATIGSATAQEENL